MKVLIVGDNDDSLTKTALLAMMCAKMGIPVEVIKEKKSQDISEIIQELFLLKPPNISILEIPIFFKEPVKKKRKLFFDECLKYISFVRQPKIVHIRSPPMWGFL